MYILEHTQDIDLGDVYRMSDGRSVYVNAYTVGFVGGHPSGVDYYYQDGRGYGCQSAREVAIVYATEFPQAVAGMSAPVDAVKSKRQCEVCHADCRRKKVWSARGKRVICIACGRNGWRFDDNGQVSSGGDE